MSTKILPINQNTDLHSYTYLSNWLSILTASPYMGDSLAKFEIEGIDQFSIESNNITYLLEENEVTVKSDPYGKDMWCKIYQPLTGAFELKGHLSYLQQIDHLTGCGFFLASEEKFGFDDIEKDVDCLFGMNYMKGFFCNTNQNYQYFNRKASEAFDFKFTYTQEGLLSLFIREESKDWEFVHSLEISIGKNVYFGLFFNFMESRFYNWYFMNYLQIHCCEDLKHYYCGDALDLFYMPSKTFQYNYIHPFLNFDHMDIDYLERHKIDIIDHIKYNIDHEKYVELFLNEYYVNDRTTYKKKYFDHRNLVFGYDDQKSVIYLFGFDAYKKNKISMISYEDFRNAYKTCECNDQIIAMYYHPDDMSFDFEIDSVIMQLEDYLNSYDTSKRIASFQAKLLRVYGVSVYDIILKSEQNVIAVVSDIRISYVLWEHKKHLCDLVEFLYSRNYLDETQYHKCKEEFSDIYNKTKRFYMLLLKYAEMYKEGNCKENKENKEYKEYKWQFIENVKEMKEQDIKAISTLLQYLENK